MAKTRSARGHGFGTAPVFLAAISTILGAILFLRFGYAVGHVGMLGALAIILIGHAITIPTGLAVAEIATNLKVEGGGEYYVISRSFGATLVGTIGISLYLSQAASVAFYMIAFSEAFRPLFPWFQSLTGLEADIRMVGIPATILLLVVIVLKGAKIGVRVLWVVVAALIVSLIMFFLGKPITESGSLNMTATTVNPDGFSMVFAIVFPAFTGMTAGVGLSGDLRNPRRSIPLGTLAGTLTGMVVYILVVFKLGMSANPSDLASEPFIMSKIAIWGPIIFLEHFAGNPSYRPTFRSKWYLSLLGAVACLVMMFKMQPLYALLAIGTMGLIYLWLKRTLDEERDLSSMVQGVLFQLTRMLQVLIQKKQTGTRLTTWRPSFIAISSQSLTRLAPFDLLRWISHHYGFGTFIHYIEGPLTNENNEEARKTLQRLVEQTQSSKAGIYVDTIISPSFKTAVAQIVQIPGISGLDNNSFLFDFREGDVDAI